MQRILDTIVNAYQSYANYLWSEITLNYTYKPLWENYFYGLILVSLFFFVLEIIKPWRKNQAKFRKDFWLDFFYMFFNFFLFWLIIYNAASNVVVDLFNQLLASVGITNLVALEIGSWHPALQLFTLFIVRDFIQWNVHRLLHRTPFLWEFHKLHHSVEEMGFAAHLRFHWFETVVYRFFEYIPLAMIGFGIKDFFLVHIFTLTMGHFNHANFRLPLGPFKYIFNNPQMHIWHHAYDIPEDHKYGVNFGLTLSIWDYLFGTAYIPHNGRDIRLGFQEIEKYPKNFFAQIFYGFSKKRKNQE